VQIISSADIPEGRVLTHTVIEIKNSGDEEQWDFTTEIEAIEKLESLLLVDNKDAYRGTTFLDLATDHPIDDGIFMNFVPGFIAIPEELDEMLAEGVLWDADEAREIFVGV
jgi:hypothetical protein